MNRTEIRPAAVAGLFYPDDRAGLLAAVDQLLDAAKESEQPKAMIVPHAGYIYSGTTAADAYKSLQNKKGSISRVILLGPSHQVAINGLAASSAASFSTPLGDIPVDPLQDDAVSRFAQLKVMDDAHQVEHSLEVQLPFLQRALGEFTLIPLVVGRASAEEVAEVLEFLWGGDETIVVISSDLSHYLDYASAQQQDGQTSRAIVGMEVEKIAAHDACGSVAIKGLLTLAKRKHLDAKMVALRNSGDTAGDKSRVVGYGAYLFY